jgi:hypothetical protein
MPRTTVFRLFGVLLLVYGFSAILLSWYAYSLTREAFGGIRSFATLFERERTQALDTLKGAVGLLGDAGGSSADTGPGLGSRVAGIQGQIRGLLGGQAAGAQPPAPASGTGLGLLDDLNARLNASASNWGKLGEGPISLPLLNRVEFATNAVLAWVALQGLLCLGLAIYLFSWKPQTVALAPPYPPPGWQPGQWHPQDPRYPPPVWQQPTRNPGPPARPDPPTQRW